MKHETLVFSKRAVDELEEKLIKQLNRTEPLQKQFKYVDYKGVLLGEGEHEEHPVYPPIV